VFVPGTFFQTNLVYVTKFSVDNRAYLKNIVLFLELARKNTLAYFESALMSKKKCQCYKTFYVSNL